MDHRTGPGPVVPKQRIIVGGGSTHVGIGHRDSPDAPAINVIKTGSSIQAIEITCPCGKFIRLLCEYEQ